MMSWAELSAGTESSSLHLTVATLVRGPGRAAVATTENVALLPNASESRLQLKTFPTQAAGGLAETKLTEAGRRLVTRMPVAPLSMVSVTLTVKVKLEPTTGVTGPMAKVTPMLLPGTTTKGLLAPKWPLMSSATTVTFVPAVAMARLPDQMPLLKGPTTCGLTGGKPPLSNMRLGT